MVSYKFIYETEFNNGYFVVTAINEKECLEIGYKIIAEINGNVLDYYEV